MNRRIKKKVAKRQLIKAMQGLVDLAAGSRRPLQLNIGRAALQIGAAQYKPPIVTDKAAFFIPKIQQSKFFRAAQRQKVRKIYGIF